MTVQSVDETTGRSAGLAGLNVGDYLAALRVEQERLQAEALQADRALQEMNSYIETTEAMMKKLNAIDLRDSNAEDPHQPSGAGSDSEDSSRPKPAPQLPTSMAGLTWFVLSTASNADAEWTSSMILEAIVSAGAKITVKDPINGIQLALGQLVDAGKVERIRKGVYKLIR